ncbi:unnamed protein product, partial [Porites evermanni]
SSHLINIFDIYGLSQLITEPTRVTQDSKTLIDLCITNSPEKITNSGKFLSDLNQLPWANVDLYSDPNEMWHVWKEMFLGCFDKHAPLKSERIRKKRSPWITR